MPETGEDNLYRDVLSIIGTLDAAKRRTAPADDEDSSGFDPTDGRHFRDLLRELEQRGYPADSDEHAVRTALAVVARQGNHSWPPPSELVAALVRPLAGKPRYRPRALEFVCLTLLGHEVGAGWTVDRSRSDWYGLTYGAQWVVAGRVERCIKNCLNVLHGDNFNGGIPGMPTLEAADFLDQAMNRVVLSAVHNCKCYLHARGNHAHQRLKAERCGINHHVGNWNPAKESLWQLLDKAIQGSYGTFRHDSFPSGVLCDLLRDGESSFEVVRGSVVRRRCAYCNRLTVYRRCNHPAGAYQPAHEELIAEEWLLLRRDGELQGDFVRTEFWRCANNHLVEAGTDPCPRCGADKKPGSRPIHAYLILEQPSYGRRLRRNRPGKPREK